MLRHFPNFLTCCNLLCGIFGLLHIFEERSLFPIAYFVWLAGAFDFLDGFAARALKVHSPIGKELDSLADVVSFGVLPGLFMYHWIASQSPASLAPLAGILVVIFSALRLAIFNVDETQSDSFKGLPTPANAIFLTGLPFLEGFPFDLVLSPMILVILCTVFSFLLVSRIELFALKFGDFSWRQNKLRFTFLLCSVILLATLKFAAIPLIILFYLVLSFGVRVASGRIRTQ